MNVHRLIKWADQLLTLSPPGAAAKNSILSKLRTCLDKLPSCRAFIRRFRADATPLLACQKILKTKGLSDDSLAQCEPLTQTIASPGLRSDFQSYLHKQMEIAKTLDLDKIGLPIGTEKKDIIGKTDYDFFDKELAEFFRENDSKALAAGKPNSNEEWLTFAAGGYRGLFDTIKTPMFSADGKLIGVLGIAHDITGRRRAEQDYQMLFREMLDGFALHEIICNEAGYPTDYRFLAVNPAFERMTGLKADDIVGKSVLEIFPGTEHQWIETYGKVALTGEPAFFENYSAELKKYFEVTAFQPDPSQFACIFADITDRQKAREEKAKLDARLQQAQKMEAIGTLAGGIAHDLNNLLFPISGLSEILLDDITPDNPMHENIVQILNSAKRGSDLVKQILAFSRQSNPQKIPVRIQTILKEALKLSRAAIPMNIEIKTNINTDCRMVSADPTQVHQIVMNLITNAYHAVEQTGGVIHVELKETVIETDNLHVDSLKSGKYACMTISDTGTGIDQSLIDKIFDPYFTTKELGKGTGLGLSVVHGIVKDHGGDIRVYSEVDKGTVFHVYLPLLEDATDSITTTENRKYPTGSERILLVDDEVAIVRMVQTMLEKQGYHVTAITSSLDALDAFRANPSDFDLVISDRGMPNMTGEQLAMELISIEPAIPIIICTGFSDENDENRAREIGVKGILKKPVGRGDLADMVRKVLDEAADNTLANKSGQADTDNRRRRI
jgi:PAS domain S-box-containing protein